MKFKLKLSTSILAALVACSSLASAITMDTLANLTDTNGSLTVGDKTFSGFGYKAVNLSGFNPIDIRVTASVAADGTYYLTWAGSIAVSTLSSTTPAVGDLLLNYVVTAATPNVITMIGQAYAGGTTGGIGALLINETVKNTAGVVVANSQLDLTDLSDPFAEVGDNLYVTPGQSSLKVTKDIALSIVATDRRLGLISVSEVSQSFHQNTVPGGGSKNTVPDSGSAVGLLGIALVAIESFRRKMRTLGLNA